MSTSRAKRGGHRVNCSGYVQNPPPPTGDGKRIAVSSRTNYAWLDTRVTGDDVRDWKERIKRCESATTTLVGSKTYIKSLLGVYARDTDWTKHPYTSRFSVSGEVFSVPPRTDTSTLALDRARALAYAAFAKDVRKRTRSWQGGVFAGELVETARMLSSPLKGFYKHTKGFVDKSVHAWRGVRSRNPTIRNARKLKNWHTTQPYNELRKAINSLYLEYTFGIRPLINDINDATEAFNAVRNKEEYDSVRFKGTGKYHIVDTYVGPGNSVGLANGIRCTTFAKKYAEVYVTGAMRNSNPAGEMPLAQRFGLDLSNVAPTAWELIPMSWIFDYFVNIGTAIDAWSLRFMDFGWIQQTEVSGVLTTLGDFQITEPGNPGRYRMHVYRNGHAHHRYVTRSARDNDFITPFTFKLPGHSMQWLNIAAVAGAWSQLVRDAGRLRY